MAAGSERSVGVTRSLQYSGGSLCQRWPGLSESVGVFRGTCWPGAINGLADSNAFRTRCGAAAIKPAASTRNNNLRFASAVTDNNMSGSSAKWKPLTSRSRRGRVLRSRKACRGASAWLRTRPWENADRVQRPVHGGAELRLVCQVLTAGTRGGRKGESECALNAEDHCGENYVQDKNHRCHGPPKDGGGLFR